MNKFLLLLLLPFMLNAINYEITVPANVDFFDSEIIVYENELVSIKSEGIWQYDPRPNFKTGPDGLVKGQFSLGALQVKCNNNIFLIGSEWEGKMPGDCTLKLGMYDNIGHANNVGSLNVNIEIEREVLEEITEDEIEEEKQEELVEEKVEMNDSSNDKVCSILMFLVLLCAGALYVKEN